MLCSSATLIAFAVDEVAINIEEMPGYEKAYIGAPIETAPVQDGTIGDEEYQHSVKRYPLTFDKLGTDMSTYTNYTTEYYAYDANYIYYAVTNPMWYSAGAQMDIRLEHDFIMDATPSANSSNRSHDDKDAMQLAFGAGTAWSVSSVPEGKTAPAEGDIASFLRHDGSYQEGVLEVKISRAYLAAQMGLESAADVTKFTYSTYITDVKLYAGGGWVYANMDHYLTADQMAWLAEQGVETPMGNEAGKLNRVCYMAVLGEDPNKPINIEEMPGYSKAYVGKAIETAPVQDGTINDDEYTLVRKVKHLPSNKYKMATPTNDFTECFAYDSEFIYYAVSYPGAYRTMRQFFIVRLTQDYIIDQTPAGNTHKQLDDSQYGLRLVTSSDSEYTNSIPSGKSYPTSEEYVCVRGRSAANGTYAPITYELKISRSYLATQMGLDDASDVTKLFYSFFMDDCAFDGTTDAGGRWGWISCDHMLTDEQDEWLVSKGVTTSLDNSDTSGASLTRLYNMVVLGEDPDAANNPDNFSISIEEMPGYKKNYIGSAITTAPAQDGVINTGEYTYSKTLKPLTVNNMTMDMDLYTNVTTEYMSYDNEWIYYAVTNPYWYSAGASIDIRLEHDYVIDGTPLPFPNRSIEDEDAMHITFSTSGYSTSMPAGKTAPTAEQLVAKLSHSGTSYTAGVLEFKISRAYLAAQMGLESASDVTKFSHSTYITDVLFSADGTAQFVPEEGNPMNWTYANTDIILTEEQMAWLAEQGVVTTMSYNPSSAFNRVFTTSVLGYADVSVSVTTRETASIRVSASNPGLRFKTDVVKSELDALVDIYGAENVKIGTLITLDELRSGAAITADAEFTVVDVAATLNAPFETGDDVATYAGSITNIKPANLAKDFAAVGYVAYRASADSEWVYIYSGATAVRNVTFVAQAAVDANEFEGDTAALEILEKLGAVIA